MHVLLCAAQFKLAHLSREFAVYLGYGGGGGGGGEEEEMRKGGEGGGWRSKRV